LNLLEAGFADKKGNPIDFTGMIILGAMKAENIPEGWLLCDGSSISKAEYKNLFSVIGDQYGSVDDEHFTLPDYLTIDSPIWLIKY
jgi:microcystin-dependent protein